MTDADQAVTVARLAAQVSGEVEGDGSRVIRGMASLQDAGPDEVSFLANARYAADAQATRAGAIVVGRDWKRHGDAALIRVDSPDAAFAAIASLFVPELPRPQPGSHPSAVVAPDVSLGAGASVGPHCVIEGKVVIGEGTEVAAGTFVGFATRIGRHCHIYPNVTLRERVTVGDRVIVHSGTVVGSDGFGYTVDAQGVRTKVPQIGTVVIGDDVEIGANVAIDRARFGATRIGKGVKIDNLVQIAHNVIVGDHAVIVAQVGIAGSTEIGAHAILAGQAGIAGHLKVGRGAVVLAQAGVSHDVEPGTQVMDFPALPRRQSLMLHRHYLRLPQLKQKLDEIERKLDQLLGNLASPGTSSSSPPGSSHEA